MTLRDTWKIMRIFLKRNEGFHYRILEKKTKKVVQASCHLLSITKSLKGTDCLADVTWGLARGLSTAQYMRTSSCPSSTLASKALLCAQLLQEGELAGPPRGPGSLGVCL